MNNDLFIKRAIYMGNYTILFESEEGEYRVLDLKPLLKENMGAFENLRTEENFKQFYIDTGILTWNNGFDLAPEYVFENSAPMIFQQGKGEFLFRYR